MISVVAGRERSTVAIVLLVVGLCLVLFAVYAGVVDRSTSVLGTPVSCGNLVGWYGNHEASIPGDAPCAATMGTATTQFWFGAITGFFALLVAWGIFGLRYWEGHAKFRSSTSAERLAAFEREKEQKRGQSTEPPWPPPTS